MKMVRATAMLEWSALRESRELSPAEFIDWDPAADDTGSPHLVFISHRWITPSHPDPHGDQLREVHHRLRELDGNELRLDDTVVFYDYCAMFQRPRTPTEDAAFYQDIGNLETLARKADRIIVLSEGYTDYKHRSWCFLEAIVSQAALFFFEDQQAIRDDLAFMGQFLSEKFKQFSSYDFSFKLHAREAEIMTAICQHLAGCRVTHVEDVPLIKAQMIQYLNRRRVTPFGKLVIALNRYFDVCFAILDEAAQDDLICRPYFAAPDWHRLPPIQSDSLLGTNSGHCLFALPPDDFRRLATGKSGFFPALRVTAPGVRDHAEFLQRFQRDPDWKEFIVSPIRLGEATADCFPTVDHVMHTILERPPGLFLAPDGSALYVRLD